MSDIKYFLIIILCAAVLEFVFFWMSKYIYGAHFRRHLSPKLVSVSASLIPVWGLIFLLSKQNIGYIKIFLVSAFVGTLLESALGRFLYNILGKPVWKYSFGRIGKFTSWISIPYWGGAGLLFLYLAKLVGI